MPKKKLTKAQVKKKLTIAGNNVYDLILDKLNVRFNSDVPFSTKKLFELHNIIQLAIKRIK